MSTSRFNSSLFDSTTQSRFAHDLMPSHRRNHGKSAEEINSYKKMKVRDNQKGTTKNSITTSTSIIHAIHKQQRPLYPNKPLVLIAPNAK